ncbi:MAG: hypothetical protein LBH05_09020 [Deferribacteraceae bacterium]|jgi:threonine aldolase|nr:hypothetical protein [Deferribacteraceae bacterium]
MIINFASDNAAGVHPKVIEKLSEVNEGAVPSYGNDPYTREAVEIFKKMFGSHAEIFFVYNGTGANTAALTALTERYGMILTAHAAHITEDECGAPVIFTGAPIQNARSAPGKLTPADLTPFMSLKGDEHKSQPTTVSVSQATETGEVYAAKELRAISEYCKSNDLLLHIDGARLANAAVRLGCDIREVVYGADILCFGGTKNGLMGAEALVALNPAVAAKMPYIRKKSMQLASKMRYLSAQFLAILENDLWLSNAEHANKMTDMLRKKIEGLPGIKILYPADANMLFIEMPNRLFDELIKSFYFYPQSRNAERTTARIMTSWQTTEEEIQMFQKTIQVNL